MAKSDEGRVWQRVRRRTAALLLLWALLVVAIPWWARELDRWTFAGVPLGYWCSSSGLLLFFVGFTVLNVRWIEAAEADSDEPLSNARREADEARPEGG